MFIYMDWLVQREQTKDLLSRAAQERLARLALSTRTAAKAKKGDQAEPKAESHPTQVCCCSEATP